MLKDQFKNEFSIVKWVPGGKWKAEEYWACCPFHKENTASFSWHDEKAIFYCFGCHATGDVFDFIEKFEGIPFAEICKKYDIEKESHMQDKPSKPILPTVKPVEKVPAVLKKPFEEVCRYYYLDELGRKRFKVVRQETYTEDGKKKKNFPCSTLVEGKEKFGIHGARVLYNLPDIMRCDTVAIAEGEKDAETLKQFLPEGIACTSKMGGTSSEWLDAYTDSVKDKTILLFKDNDEPGLKQQEAVLNALAGKVKLIKLVDHPEEFSDITDYLDEFSDEDKAKEALIGLVKSARAIHKGIDSSVHTVQEIIDSFHLDVGVPKDIRMDYNFPFLCDLGGHGAGDIVTFIAPPGAGKTAFAVGWCSEILKRKHKVLFLSLELSEQDMIKRFVSYRDKRTYQEITQEVFKGNLPKMIDPNLCIDETLLSSENLDLKISDYQAKIGTKPDVVIIDYIQLMSAGGSMAEKMLEVPYLLKRKAKQHKIMFLVLAQVTREAAKEDNVTLHSVYYGEALGQSSGVVLGLNKQGLLTICKSTNAGYENNHTTEIDKSQLKHQMLKSIERERPQWDKEE